MWIVVLLVLIILDQFTKHYLYFVTNTGAAFGILKGFNIPLLIVSLVALIFCIYFYVKEKKLRLSLIFLMAGIVGNSIDRIFLGHVRDFIDIGIFNFPVFNLADSYNVIGVIIIIIILQKSKPKSL